MIRNVADLLFQVLSAELPKLDSSEVLHAPTIGDMYEGLSGHILERAIPDGLGLQVVTGFVRGHDEKLSGQIDRLLVTGSGERVPHTDAYMWPVQDVIAVFEVKKTLTKPALADAIDQLDEVRALEKAYRATPEGLLTAEEEGRAVKAVAEMTGRVPPPAAQVASISLFDQVLLQALLEEATSIIRVAIGWHGFRFERALRRAVANIVGERIGRPASGPASLPQLIISGDFSVMKGNGQPFSPATDGEVWPFYSSMSANPVLLLLELIWTRLDVHFGLGNPWGEDLTIEAPRGLLFGKAVEQDGRRGWIVEVSEPSTKELRAAPAEEDWEPARFTLEAFVVVQRLCAGHEVRRDARELVSWLETQGRSVDDLFAELVSSRLVAVSPAGALELITKECLCVITPEGDYVAADNNTGRLTRWVARSRAVAEAQTDD